MVCLDFFSCGFLLLYALCVFTTKTPSILSIGILMVVLSVIQSIYDPCVRAAIPAVTSPKNLTSANSIVSVVSSLTSLLGPIAAGFLYGIFGIQMILTINIISFFFSAVMELFLTIPKMGTPEAAVSPKTYLLDIRNSFHYLTKEKSVIFQMILVSCSFNLFLTPIYTVGLPYMEKIIFGVSDQLYGISEGLVGAGMIAGAICTQIISRKLPFHKLYVYFYMVTALVIGMGICTIPGIKNVSGVSMTSYVLFTALGFVFAMALAVINILCMTYMQKEIPMEYMGKTMAVITSMSTALMPVGQLVFGVLYDSLSAQTGLIYLIVAILSIITTIITWKLIRKAVDNGSLQTV